MLEKLKKAALWLGDRNQKLGLIIIAIIVVLVVMVFVTGEKPAFFDLATYPLMIVYIIMPYICDKIRGEDTEYSSRRLLYGAIILYCLKGLF